MPAPSVILAQVTAPSPVATGRPAAELPVVQAPTHFVTTKAVAIPMPQSQPPLHHQTLPLQQLQQLQLLQHMQLQQQLSQQQHQQQQRLMLMGQPRECLSLPGQERLAAPQCRARRKRRCCPTMLALHLKKLEEHDPRCVFLMKKIKKLGFDAEALLRRHFEVFGPIDDVLLINPLTKSSGYDFAQRVRPSGMGFVIMRHAEDVGRVLAVGPEHIVSDVPIEVRQFVLCTRDAPRSNPQVTS